MKYFASRTRQFDALSTPTYYFRMIFCNVRNTATLSGGLNASAIILAAKAKVI